VAFVKAIARGTCAAAALLLLGLGALALGLRFAPPGHPALEAGRELARTAARRLGGLASPHLPRDLAERVEPFLSHPAAGFGLAPAGLALLALALRRGAARASAQGAEAEAAAGRAPADPRARRQGARTASALARRGQHAQAGEVAFENGLLEEAARYFLEAGLFERVAEIRHDQNRFVESAELYLRAGRADAAGSIFAQQEEWERAAEAYQAAGNQSVAAEMFVKAAAWERAAACFAQAGFPRHAAQAFVKCEKWLEAATHLEQAIGEEASGAGAQAPEKQAELRKLYRMAGNLYERAGRLERAEQILVKGGLHGPAAEIALRRGRGAEAASLFLEAREPVRAAQVMRGLGDDAGAARVLAEHHRDRGETAEAARQFEAAGDPLAAGELYRLLEDHARAGTCFERQGEHGQAAEMFQLAGDRARAAESFERAERYAEAAECWALAGDDQREAEALARAGEHLRAGEIHQRAGRIDEAIKVLQKVPAEGDQGVAAAALLGEIFRERGMYSLAIKKLRHALGSAEIGPANAGAFHELACCHEANAELQQAHDLYEKILAFDYHHADAGERLARVKEQLEARAGEEKERAEPEPPFGASRDAGRYQIVGKLGRGGMGIVYRARDAVLDRTVALKVLPEALKENPQALKNFLREAKSAAQLNHPNIVTVYDAGEQDGVYYIAMEYVDGSTLKEIVKARGRIAPGALVHVLAQICEGLAYAHEKKIVHRDVKTANTMWTRDRKAKIMDFGLARVIEEVRNHTTVVSGTPYYMSPEQTLGKNVDHRTDLYSLGVTLFELATGTLPFRDGNLPYHHVHTPPPDPQQLVPDLPPLLAAIIARCLQKDPAHRYQSAREILSVLRAPLG
jgi:tetratricopeptide (TPR) repeat protein